MTRTGQGTARIKHSASEIGDMVARYAAGESMETIAHVYKIGVGVVRRRLLANGVNPRPCTAYTSEGRARIAAANRRRVGAEDISLLALTNIAENLNANTQRVRDMHDTGMSVAQIGKAFGCGVAPIRRILDDFGVERRPVGWKSEKARREAAERIRAATKGKALSVEHRARLSASKLAAAEKTAKTLSLKPSGYVEFTRGPNRYRGQHRVVVEGLIGRPLLPGEFVHHIDHNRSNNDPANLLVMTASEHTTLHNHERFGRHSEMRALEEACRQRMLNSSVVLDQAPGELGKNNVER